MGLFSGKNKIEAAHEHCLLMLEIPRTNDKKELAAEQMLAALHGILRAKRELQAFRYPAGAHQPGNCRDWPTDAVLYLDA